MEHRSTRKVLVLLLGVFLALGVSLSAVQAAEMTVKMTLASDMAPSGGGGCSGCGGDDGAKGADCHPVCTAAGAAVLPGQATALVGISDPAIPWLRSPSIGRAPSPEPSPPKIDDIG